MFNIVINLIYHSKILLNPSLFEGWSTTVEEGKVFNKKMILSSNRVNTKMKDLGYDPIIEDIDNDSVIKMRWFDNLSGGKQHSDFFATRVTNYAKGVQKWDAESIF